MDRYHVTLFLHLLALVVASGTTAVTKLAASRRGRARSVGELREWHNVLVSAAKLFPVCLVVFAATGAYMLSLSQTAALSTGFVVAGMVGVALLLVNSVYLGTKGKTFGQMLDALAARGENNPPPVFVPPALVATLPVVNTGIALSVAFDMVTKPASIPLALGIVGLGIGLGAIAARPPRRAAAARTSRA